MSEIHTAAQDRAKLERLLAEKDALIASLQARLRQHERSAALENDLNRRVEQLRDLARMLAQALPGLGLVIYDHSLHLHLVEGGLFERYGLNRDALEGRTIWQALPAESARALAPLLERALRGEASHVERSYETFTYRGQTLPLRDQNERILAGMLLAVDITDQRQYEWELEALVAMVSALRTAFLSTELQDVTLNQLHVLLGCEAARIEVYDSQSNELIVEQAAGAWQEWTGMRLPMGNGLGAQALATRKPIFLNDPLAGPQTGTSPELVGSPYAAILPLATQDEPFGLLRVGRQRPFSPAELRFLTAVADVTANALFRARLMESLRQSLQVSEVMVKVGQIINQSLDIGQVLQLIVDSCRQVIGPARRAVFHLLDERAQVLRPVTVSGGPEIGRPSLAMSVGQGVAGAALRDGLLINVADIMQDPRYLPDRSDDGRMRALLVAPVLGRAGAVGTLSVQSDQANAFDEADERLLTQLAYTSGIAIENAHLYERERLQRQQAEALSEAALTLNRSLELETVLDAILEQVLNVAPGETANIMLIEGGEAVMSRMHGYQDTPERIEALQRLRLPLSAPGYAEMLASRQPVIVDDVAALPGWLPSPGTEWVRSYVGAPLIVGGQVAGFLNVDSHNAYRFSPGTAARLRSFAAQASLAIENARLFSSLRQALAQEQAARTRLALAAKLADMGRMVATVAHELNNPLQTIRNCLYILNKKANLQPPLRDYLQMGIAEIGRIESLVEQLRSAYRPGRTTPQTIDLVEVLEDVRRLVSSHLQRKFVAWEPAPAGEPQVVQGVADQLKQVFLNLILNAIEAMEPQGGGRLALSWQRRLAGMRQEVGVRLSDSGPGIPPDILPGLFDPFVTSKESGIGLGLAICYDIIQAHGGEIEVESTPGKGAVFTVWLPCANAAGECA